jgi:AraC family transcriptional regulator of adaptative response / DNA-3-methyladenine glycosylase II
VSNTGVSHTVARALALIDAGALDDAGMDALTSGLGVGERQLRRLFAQYVGASPVAVAQTRRVLLAKQLIHETQMPITEIAFAAGFGSIRRCNEVFQALYQRAPGSLRRSTKPEQSAALDGVSLLLRYRPPYDWPAMLAFLGAHAVPGLESVEDGCYHRTIRIEQEHGSVTVRQGAGHALSVTIRFPRLTSLPMIISRLRNMFDLAADPEAINRQLSVDPLMARLTAARPGLRMPGCWDGFELAARMVLQQHGAAPELVASFLARHGVALGGNEAAPHRLTHTFPVPQRLRGPDLLALGMAQACVATLVALAALLDAEPCLLDTRADQEVALRKLRALPGMSDSIAQAIAMRQLREPDAFPSADHELMRAMTMLEGASPSAAQLAARADQWRPWRAYAVWHVWASLD